MCRTQSKNHNIRPDRIKKIICLVTFVKNMYLKIDITDYYIFTNLLVNHANITLLNISILFPF